MKRFLLLLLCLPALAWGQALEIISLHHRMADELLPQLQPFVESGGALSGMNEKLFLRASRRNQEEIRRLVAELDRPARRLMISVRQEGEEDVAGRGGAVQGRIVLSERKVGADGTARLYSSSRASSDRVNQQVQTLDGGRAAIHVGQSIWLPFRQMVLTPSGAVVSESVVQRDLGTGFVVVPRLSGERVTVDISPQHETAGTLPGSAHVERLSTTVSGPLGEWLVLGGSGAEEASRDGHWSAGSASRQRRLLLKVDLLP